MYTARGVRSTQKPRETEINHHDPIITPCRNDKQLSSKTDRDRLILINIPSTGETGTYVGHFSSRRTVMIEAEWKVKCVIYLKENIYVE